jgi:Polyketide synthase dehydratase N-terminal domain
MADLSEITGRVERQCVRIEVPTHWADHRVMGRAVLPAVEAMQLLTRWTARFRPGSYRGFIRQAAFDKFLDLPPPGETIDAFCDVTDLSNGAVLSVLATRRQARSAAITRTITHAQVVYEPTPPVADMPSGLPFAPAGPCFSVAPHTIYDDLVPFGPAYRNISQPLQLAPEGALAFIQAPIIEDTQTDAPLGSPFVPDAAFHAACVWSQRFAGVVAFPVGIDERRIVNPTRGGETYIGRILPVRMDAGLLVFDILLLDPDGGHRELLRGVRMRDVSGGRLRPPEWIAAVARVHP